MTVLWIIIPLAVVAIAIAVVPVLAGSVVHDKSVKEGDRPTTEQAVGEANHWHRRLGRPIRRSPKQLTPDWEAPTATAPSHRKR
jgi:hypothetical protein